jgi:hypothetical protein
MQDNQNPTDPVVTDPSDEDHVLPPEATAEPQLATTAPVEQPAEPTVIEAAPEPAVDAVETEQPASSKGKTMLVVIGLVALIAIALLVMLFLYFVA